jgi:hypothetical protein
MSDLGIEQVSISIEARGADSAREAEEAFEQTGISDFDTVGEGQEGVLPILIIVGAVLAVSAAIDVIERWRKGHMCQQLIDARGEKLIVSKDCSMKNGRIIVVSKDDQKVEIHDVPEGVDIGKIVEAALDSGADAVKSAAAAIGAKARDPRPADTEN